MCVAIFTSQPVVLQICLNGEPVLTTSGDTKTFNATSPNFNIKNGSRRHVHTAGEVTCVSTDQFLSLPPNAKVEIRFHSKKVEQRGSSFGIGVQGFITINKF